jgi:hypothetical protein
MRPSWPACSTYTPGEEGPDLSDYEPEVIGLLSEYAAPPGTYHDMFPLHLLTSASVEYMAAASGANFDRRRFRPSLYVESAAERRKVSFS